MGERELARKGGSGSLRAEAMRMLFAWSERGSGG